ncbi:DUF2271 domain-containing protein [Sulfidibacter corallicola]|uniref:DUF2271 domain-containing protein n=1 Tax=Sulfidibacter corallicola TaxID=2818388 RepID=A0A8A4TNW6_SULCO|nr:DUF2271 domain-containing protein [Sulfidibacter corallicola]QTD50648.1 DUF2271 domain-containing protein [Sulfidibacter corallicola]
MNSCLLLLVLLGSPAPAAEGVRVEIVIPQLDARPYHRPYVAIWLETTERKGVHTLAVWHEQDEWLKDMRQWWRKLGRSKEPPYDAVSGATRKPGSYRVLWNGLDAEGRPLPAGEYYLNVEAAREEGGRDFLRQKVVLGGDKPQHYTLTGRGEIGEVHIEIDGGK